MSNWLPFLILLTIYRVVFTILLFIMPFTAGLIGIFLDTIDGNFLFALDTPREIYQNYDKALDLLAYVVMLIIGLKTPIKKYIKLAFIYRLIGQILFFCTHDRTMFFFFPNFLEMPFLAYFGFKKFGKENVFLKYRIPIYIFLGINKLWMEYSNHIAHFNWSGFVYDLLGLKL